MVNRANWEPLLEFAPEEIDDFMWMFEIELEDGSMVQAYKHWWTRRYLYLDFAGRAFVEVGPRTFDQVDPARSLEEVLAGRERDAKIVRQNVRIAGDDIRFARSATRHPVLRRHTLNVVCRGPSIAGDPLDGDAGAVSDRLLGGGEMANVRKEKSWITPSGEEITEEDAERIADEVESEDEVVWARRIFVGRPSLDGKGISPRVSFRIPSELYKEVQVRANKERRTVSDITREALEKFLEG